MAKNRKNALATLGTPTPGSGKIGRRHRYEHENLAEVVSDLQDQVDRLQATLGAPGGGNVAGTTIVGGSVTGDGQGPLPASPGQGDGQGPQIGPAGPPGPAGPAGGGIAWPIIVLWDLANGPIPPGWSRCDGTNGTSAIVSGSDDPLLQLSETSGLVAAADFTFSVAGNTADATLATTCILQGTGAAIQVLTVPSTHNHALSLPITFAAGALTGNLKRWKLVPIQWVG